MQIKSRPDPDPLETGTQLLVRAHLSHIEPNLLQQGAVPGSPKLDISIHNGMVHTTLTFIDGNGQVDTHTFVERIVRK